MQTRSLDPADVGRAYDIRSRAFGPLAPEARPGWEASVHKAVDERRTIAVYDDGLLVGRAMIWAFQQYWGGRPVAMAGVAGVVVSPEYRGRGVGGALMDGVIERGRELGFPVSALYPATVPVYRRRGWEMAGVQARYTIQTGLLRELRGGSVAVREAGPADAQTMQDLTAAAYAAGSLNGPRVFPASELTDDLEDHGVFAYLADDGFVVYGWDGKELVVYQLVARSSETARALWAVVGSGSSVSPQVHAYLAPDDPLHQLLGESVVEEVRQTRWMLRLLDLSAAVVGRGFAPGVDLDVPIAVHDAQVPSNCLTGRLRVADGRGELVADGPTGADAVRLTANGIAALYAGTSMASLTTAGVASGGSAEDHARLDAAFVGRPAYLLDYF
ncbi:MAG: GNAT family N-acetyltransferase [Nocardioidaceae bacterium]|jgi:predicted acetyltransferase